MTRFVLPALVLAALSAPVLAPSALAPLALADGGAGNTLGSLRNIGSTKDLNRPVSGPASGRVTGIAVDPSDPSSARHFNGVVSRMSQGDSAKPGNASGNATYVGSANGGAWKTTNGASASNSPGVGFLRSTDGGATWSKPATPPSGHNTGALRAKTN